MKHIVATTCILTGALLSAGCATKKYVRNTTAPIQAKVDQVGEQTTRQGQAIEESKTRISQVDENAQSGISAAKESAAGADRHAGQADEHANQAMNRAQQAGEAADRANRDLGDLRNVVANLDDYKMQAETTVPFGFNRWVLNADAKKQLDDLVAQHKDMKRYFVAVEGYTDRTGSAQYNAELSRKRADAVVNYLVAKHDIPIYRIHMIGLGKEKPADEGRGRAARAKNRRVEVKIFSADQTMASSQGMQNQTMQNQTTTSNQTMRNQTTTQSQTTPNRTLQPAQQ